MSAKQIEILHLIYFLSKGGAARAMLANAHKQASNSQFKHAVITLLPPDPEALALAQKYNVEVIHSNDRQELLERLKRADIVQVEWWNEPMLADFLKSDLPAMRLISWVHVAGNKDPQYLTADTVNFFDHIVATSPACAEAPELLRLSEAERNSKVSMIYAAADFSRVKEVKPKEHRGFHIGYIGTVNPLKMHPDFLALCGSINIPGARFVVCGGDQQHSYMAEAQRLGLAARFNFQGYVEDIAAVMETFDVYGYPLCEDTFASSELNLQEVMYAGIPAVVFPYGGLRKLVQHNETGLIVNTAAEYKEAIEFLYHNPAERARLGANASAYARKEFSEERAASEFIDLYKRLLEKPKSERFWGQPAAGTAPTLQLSDLLGSGTDKGAAHFLDTLGETEKLKMFQRSLLGSHTIEDALKADEQIKQASPVLRVLGVLTFRGYYPEDPYLTYWSGLVQLGNRDYQSALVDFAKAVNLKFPDWRPYWQIYLTVKAVGDVQAEAQLMEMLKGSVPADTLGMMLSQ